MDDYADVVGKDLCQDLVDPCDGGPGEYWLTELLLDGPVDRLDVAPFVVALVEILPSSHKLVVLAIPDRAALREAPRVHLERDERVEPEVVRPTEVCPGKVGSACNYLLDSMTPCSDPPEKFKELGAVAPMLVGNPCRQDDVCLYAHREVGFDPRVSSLRIVLFCAICPHV